MREALEKADVEADVGDRLLQLCASVACPRSPKNTSSGRPRISPTRMRGLSEASGFWNTYWIARRSLGRPSPRASAPAGGPCRWIVAGDRRHQPAKSARDGRFSAARFADQCQRLVSGRSTRLTPCTTVVPADAPIPNMPRRRAIGDGEVAVPRATAPPRARGALVDERRGLEQRHGGKQCAGIGMLRPREDLLGVADLDQFAAMHDAEPVGDLPQQRQVVRDIDHRHAAAGAQRLQEFDDLLLHGHVEAGGRLVEHDEGGIAGERHGDGDALLLAAGKTMRIARRRRPRMAPSPTCSISSAKRASIAARPSPLWVFSTSAIWSRTVMAGFSAVVGFCGTKPMRFPRSRCSAADVERRDVGSFEQHRAGGDGARSGCR